MYGIVRTCHPFVYALFRNPDTFVLNKDKKLFLSSSETEILKTIHFKIRIPVMNNGPRRIFFYFENSKT